MAQSGLEQIKQLCQLVESLGSVQISMERISDWDRIRANAALVLKGLCLMIEFMIWMLNGL